MLPENKILLGDCAKILQDFPEDSVDLIITSPPYDELRSYQGFEFNFEEIAKQLFRVLKPGGVLVWVVGDAVINKSETGSSFEQALYFKNTGFLLHDTMIYEKNTSSFPARRTGNRYTQIFEYMFVFSKLKPPKTANLICDKKNKWVGWTNWGKKTHRNVEGELIETEDFKPVPELSPRNNIWKYSVGGGIGQKDKLAYQHPATFPELLVQDHINSWSMPGDVVLDPMCGSGTACKVAAQLDRKYIGIEISADYCLLAEKRVQLVLDKKGEK